MRIIIETALNSGRAEFLNLGDVSMLQVAVRRLRRLWPSARICVLTDSPEDLNRYCPGSEPLSRVGRDHWIGASFVFGWLHRYFPGWLATLLQHGTEALERTVPALLDAVVRLRLRIRTDEQTRWGVDTFLQALEAANLLVVCGAGGFADGSEEWSLATLGVVASAVRRGIPVVMLGQQMGPLREGPVLARARSVLPGVDLITLRGNRGAGEFVASLGVAPSRVQLTGDEAVELAYEARTAEPGHALGINLRVAYYVDAEHDVVDRLRPVLQEFARRHQVPMLPVPIAFHQWASDHLVIRQLLEGFDDESDGGRALDTPLRVIQQAGRCRVVVTGAYHAAVFALAQGIPVVCLAGSSAYLSTFLGLQDQFGCGCETLLLRDPELIPKLESAMETAWRSADEVRLPLQRVAERQIDAGHRSYDWVRDVLGSRDAADGRIRYP